VARLQKGTRGWVRERASRGAVRSVCESYAHGSRARDSSSRRIRVARHGESQMWNSTVYSRGSVNLVDNADQVLRSREVQSAVGAARCGAEVVIRSEDEGIGMPAGGRLSAFSTPTTRARFSDTETRPCGASVLTLVHQDRAVACGRVGGSIPSREERSTSALLPEESPADLGACAGGSSVAISARCEPPRSQQLEM